MFSPLAEHGGYDADCLMPSWLDGGDMYVSDFVRQSVLFLGNKDAKTGRFHPRATAFVVSIHEGGLGFRFVVTADHAISGFAEKGWEIYVRSNLISGGVREDNWSKGHWYFHPLVGTTDVAIAPIDFQPDEEFKTILLRSDGSLGPGSQTAIAGTAEILREKTIGLGDEVFIVGLFRSHYGLQRNIPILRVGNLAMMKGEPVKTDHCGYTEAYLVEARSIGGLSGSPVFVHVPVFEPRGGTVTQFYLLGLMHGHFDIPNLTEDTAVDAQDDPKRGINTGIGVVIPVEKIIETIDQPELVEMRRKAIQEHRAKGGAKADFDGEHPASDENPTHLEDFKRLVDVAARKRPQGDRT
jgi:hypothetical protein